ncbi:MAG: thrombospondin type 3 repeat-containing protein [Patescibacteria group bacterium]
MKKITIAILSLLLLLSTSSAVIAANSITNRLKGRLLLQVQDKGRIWYVDPIGEQKHEVTFKNALNLFQSLSLGITNADLNQIPLNPDSVSNDVDTDNDGYSDKEEVINGYNPEVASTSNNRGNDKVKINNGLINRLKGRLLLQVQDRGRIWYIDNNGKRWEITWKNLMDRFRHLALGITDKDLGEVGSIDTANWQTYTNKEYGLEFKYPNYLNLRENNLAEENSFFLSTFFEDGDEYVRMMFEINGAGRGPIFNDKIFIVSNKNGQINVTETKETKKTEVEKKDKDDGIEWITASLTDNDNFYFWDFHSNKTVSQEGTFNQILSTFKFTE